MSLFIQRTAEYSKDILSSFGEVHPINPRESSRIRLHILLVEKPTPDLMEKQGFSLA